MKTWQGVVFRLAYHLALAYLYDRLNLSVLAQNRWTSYRACVKSYKPSIHMVESAHIIARSLKGYSTTALYSMLVTPARTE